MNSEHDDEHAWLDSSEPGPPKSYDDWFTETGNEELIESLFSYLAFIKKTNQFHTYCKRYLWPDRERWESMPPNEERRHE